MSLLIFKFRSGALLVTLLIPIDFFFFLLVEGHMVPWP